MSGRTVFWFALAGLLPAALAARAGAQTPVAPMPRPGGGIEIEIDLCSFPGVLSRVRSTPPPNCAFDFLDRGIVATAPMPREKEAPGLRFNLGPTVWQPPPFSVPADRGPFDHRQLVNISSGVFGGDDMPTPPAPPEAGCRTAMHGTILSAGESWRIAETHACPAPPLSGSDMPSPPNPPNRYHFGDTRCTDGVTGRLVLPPSPAVERCRGVILWSPNQPAAASQYQPHPGCCAGRPAPAPQPTCLWHVFPYPLANVAGIVRDESGTWWVEMQRVPQPKHSTAGRPACAPVAQPTCGIMLHEAIATAIERPVVAPDKAGKLVGTWVRDLDAIVIAATFTGDELKLCITQKAETGDGESVTIESTITADYAATKEGLVHGVVTSIDLNAKGDSKAGGAALLGMERVESSAMFQQVVDSPFAFRVKHTSAGVMVSGIKIAGLPGIGGQEFALFGGLYKPCKDGAIPAPKPMKPQTSIGGMTLPSGRHLEGHYPQYFSPTPDHPLPRELAAPEGPPAPPLATAGAPPPPLYSGPSHLGLALGPPIPSLPPPPPPPLCKVPPPTFCPAPAANVPAGEFGLMADVLGQMLGVSHPQPAPQLLPPPMPLPQPVPYPAPIQQVGGPPSPPPSVVVTTPMPSLPAPPAPRPTLVGTWVREVGPVVYVVKIAPDHLTITATAATEVEDGKVSTEGMVLTADYHLTRDGTTIVGLVTSVDALIDDPEFGGNELPRLGEELARVQKLLTDKPFALGVRVYGDVLAIGNVRLPEAEGRGTLAPLDMLGGRYTAVGNKPLPKPKAVKANGPRPSLPPTPPVRVSETPLPVGYDLPPRSPNADTLPPLDVPLTPTPAAPAGEPKAGKKGKKKVPAGFLLNVYSPDPNVRMQQLLYQSEDMGLIKNEWRRLWFNDQPSHLAPERIHGGIR